MARTRKPVRNLLVDAPATAALLKQAACQWVAAGRSLAAFCRQDGAPSYPTLCEWRSKDAAFDSALEQAKQHGCDAIADAVLETTDAAYVERDGDGRVDTAHVQWIKTQADVRLRLLASWSPRYGRVQVDQTVRSEPLTDAQRADEVRRLLAVAEQRKLGEAPQESQEPAQ